MANSTARDIYLDEITDATRLGRMLHLALAEIAKSREVWRSRLPGVEPSLLAVGTGLPAIGSSASEIRHAIRRLETAWAAERAAWRDLLAGSDTVPHQTPDQELRASTQGADSAAPTRAAAPAPVTSEANPRYRIMSKRA